MTKQPFWQLGRVVELIPGYDGKCRAVKVRKGDGATGTTTTHALKHLYPMELALTHDFVATEPNLKAATAEIVGTGSVEPDVNSSLIDSVNNNLIDSETVSDAVRSEPVVTEELTVIEAAAEPVGSEPVVTESELMNQNVAEPVETDVNEIASESINSDLIVNNELVEVTEIVEPAHMVEESEPEQVPINIVSRRPRRIRPNKNDEFLYY